MTRRSWVLAAFGLLAVLASVPAALLLTSGPPSATPAPAAARSEAPPAPSPAAAEPTPAAESTPAAAELTPTVGMESPGATSTDVVDAAYWKMSFEMGFLVPEVEIGTLRSGPTATVQLEVRAPVGVEEVPNRRIFGPRGGLVVLLEDDGPQSVLSSIDATTGDRRELARLDELVVDGAFIDESRLVVLTADRTDGAPREALVVDVSGADPMQPLDGLLAEASEFRLVARAKWITRLYVSPDGALVGVQRCVKDACTLRVLRLEDGALFTQRMAFEDEIIGIADGRAVIYPFCDTAECNGELLDLETGERSPVPGDGWQSFRAELVDSRFGPLLVTLQEGPAAPLLEGNPASVSIDVVELDGLRNHPGLAVELGSMMLGVGSTWDVELPMGWLPVQGSPPAAGALAMPQSAYALNPTELRVVPLPALGEFVVNG